VIILLRVLLNILKVSLLRLLFMEAVGEKKGICPAYCLWDELYLETYDPERYLLLKIRVVES
jgi:hypothetical protein